MKKFLFSAFACSAFFILACNDAGTDTDDTNEADTSMSQSDTSTPVSDVMTKSGLPLAGNQEVPTNNSTATGTADVSYNKATKTLTFTVNYNGLTGKPSMAHIHGTAPKGTNAGVVHDLSPKLQKEVSGSFSDTVTIDGKLKEDSLLSGFYYFNIHTPKHPGGEIRGQIEF